MANLKSIYDRQYAGMTLDYAPLWVPEKNLILVSITKLDHALGACVKEGLQNSMYFGMSNQEIYISEVIQSYALDKTGIWVTTDRVTEKLKELYFFSKDEENLEATIKKVGLPNLKDIIS